MRNMFAHDSGNCRVDQPSRLPNCANGARRSRPAPQAGGDTEWVKPEAFFEQLPKVLETMSSLPGPQRAEPAYPTQHFDTDDDSPGIRLEGGRTTAWLSAWSEGDRALTIAARSCRGIPAECDGSVGRSQSAHPRDPSRPGSPVVICVGRPGIPPTAASRRPPRPPPAWG